MNQIEKVIYTGKTHTTGGRNGAAQSNDGRLNIELTYPGAPGKGTNPEQLLAAGWSACFLGAIGKAAGNLKIAVPKDASVDAEVDIGSAGEAYFLRARLNVSLPGIDKTIAQELLEMAHKTCPYSKALTGNIDIELNVV